MRKQIEAAPDELQKLGYEPRDVILPTLIRWVGGLFVFLGVSSVIALIIFNLVVSHTPEAAATPEATLAVNGQPQQAPPEPRLQGFPMEDMKTFRAKEEVQLHAYTWKDKTKGVVQIPVDRAIELMADRLKVGTANGQ